MVIEVSHESPISILDKSLEYNDYAYALVHLFETHPDYYKFFKNLVDENKCSVLLDNSIFELGKSFDPVKYAEWIDKLQPNWYIVPDVLEDAPDTIQSWKSFTNEYTDNTNALRIGVVQGRDWDHLLRCYKFMSDNADYIAISFDYKYYEHTGVRTGLANPTLEKWCTGRQRFIRQLIDEGHWNWDKPHHLLGCSLAKEFSYYVNNDVYNIKSVDTSNPIVATIKGMRYNDEHGLHSKPSTLLADLIDYDSSKIDMELLEYNLKMFKKIIKR
jgi:hypothetical protein